MQLETNAKSPSHKKHGEKNPCWADAAPCRVRERGTEERSQIILQSEGMYLQVNTKI